MTGTLEKIIYEDRFPDLLDRNDWAVCVTAARYAKSKHDSEAAVKLGSLANRRLGECVISAVKEADDIIRQLHRTNKLWKELRLKLMDHAFRLAKGEMQPLSYSGAYILVPKYALETEKADPELISCDNHAELFKASEVIRKPLRGCFPVSGRKLWLNWEEKEPPAER